MGGRSKMSTMLCKKNTKFYSEEADKFSENERFSLIYEKLDELAKRLGRVTRELGAILVELDNSGGNSYFAMRYLNKNYSFRMSEMKVWMRAALGEIPEIAIEKIPSSKLVNMESRTVKDISSNKHKIWSSENQQVCLKYLKDFTKREVMENISTSGITPVGTKINDKVRVIKAYDAVLIDGKVCIVTRNGNSKMYIHLNDDIMEKANKAWRQ
jgi:hypothetical protein